LRPFLALALLLAASGLRAAPALNETLLETAVRHEEAMLRARLGMAVLDTQSAGRWAYRGDERFPLASTHKAFLCGAVLAMADRGEVSMRQTLAIDPAKLLSWSPVTGQAPPGGRLSLGDLCAAAVSHSDNSAANLLSDAIGGPSALTAFLRSIGDRQTRLDRQEPDLNEAAPGDPRDTTTPLAAAASLEKLLLGDALSAPARAALHGWMEGDRVADALLRAGLPAGWRIADKSGAGGHGARSIIALIRPPARPAVVVAIYIAETDAPMPVADAAIARLGRALAEALVPSPRPPR